MKNYEMIVDLSKHAAGSEIMVTLVCEKHEIEARENSSDGQTYYIVTKPISDIQCEKNTIVLS